MAFTIISSVGASMTAATGRSTQNHLVYAQNFGAWWVSYLSSTQAMSALYSTNLGVSWSAPTGSPFTLAAAHSSEGRDYGFGYANLASTDVLHMNAGTSTQSWHSRFTLGTTWTNTNAEASLSSVGAARAPQGQCVALDSNGRPFDSFSTFASNAGNANVAKATNADAGTSWTAGFATAVPYGTTQFIASRFLASTGSATMLLVTDNSSNGTSSPQQFTQLWSATYNGTAWSPNNASTGTTVLASSVTATDVNNWGAVARTTSDIHVVALSNNSSSFVHRRFNGTSWSAGDSVPTLTYGTQSGISLISDGTSVWAAAFDSSKNLQYSKWVSGTGWSAWTILESARTNTPKYLTGAYAASLNQIMWMWTENTGANNNIVGSTLSTAATGGPFPFFFDQSMSGGYWDAGIY